MSFFELIFYIFAILTILVVASTTRSLVRGKRVSAWKTLRVYLILAAIYGTALLAVTLALPVRMLPMGEAQYSGDWSIAPASLRRNPHDLDEDYEVDFRLSNRGDTPLRGPRGIFVYLLGENGTRYDPAPEPADPPFDALIRPGKWVMTTRRFILPTNLNRVELVIARRGLRMGMFVIGRTNFDGRTGVMLQ